MTAFSTPHFLNAVLTRLHNFYSRLGSNIGTIGETPGGGTNMGHPSMNPWTMTEALRRLRDFGFGVSTILDVGASDGTWSLAAMSLFPSAQFLLFEPLEERRSSLTLLKGTHENLDFEISAVGSEVGEVSLIVTQDLDGSRAILNEDYSGVTRKVSLTSLDASLQPRTLPTPYLLKLDVHGYELPILEGAARTLERTNVAIIEVYNFRITPSSLLFHEIVSYMDRHGFSCIDIVDPLWMQQDRCEWQIDLFFAKRDDPIFKKGILRY